MMTEDVTQRQIDILNVLRESGRNSLSFQSIAEKVRLSLQQIRPGLAELANWGYQFEYEGEDQVRLLSIPDIFFPHEIEQGLKTSTLGRNIHSFETINSTNAKAYSLAESGEPEGTLVIADRQTEGKGRLGRDWFSPGGVGIYFSLILRPKMSASGCAGISLIAALSLAETVRESPELEAMIKWPNDILVDGLKLAGILTELTTEGDNVGFVVLGCGINVNQAKGEFPEDIRNRSISLKMATGKVVNRIRLLQDFLENFEARYFHFVSHGLAPQLPLIKEYSSLLGKNISFKRHGVQLFGIARDIDPSGMLVVDTDQGELLLGSGEVTMTENYRQ